MALFKKEILKKIQEEEEKEKVYTILIVDDEKNNLETLSKVLSDDYHVLTAIDGQEALDLISQESNQNIQLIISDQRMPRLTGVEFLEKSQEIIPNVKRIILSGFADVEAVIGAINRARIYEFILKPVDAHKLLLTVRRALEAWELERNNLRMVEELQDLNRNLEKKVQERTQTLEERNAEILRTQNQLVMQQKMASVGTLTAGIAHEIKNPLNFINNFSLISNEICDELAEKLEEILGSKNERDDVWQILDDLKSNTGTIHKHGIQADLIVKSMMELSSDNSGERREVDIDLFVDEYVNLAYLGKHGKEGETFIHLFKHYGDVGFSEVVPQSLSRVVINLVNNGIESLRHRKLTGGDHYEPSLTVSTRSDGHYFEIIIEDNGIGIEATSEIFTPFYTTKEPGRGNIGLGLFVSYDIVVREHEGELKVETEPNQFARFIIRLPRA